MLQGSAPPGTLDRVMGPPARTTAAPGSSAPRAQEKVPTEGRGTAAPSAGQSPGGRQGGSASREQVPAGNVRWAKAQKPGHHALSRNPQTPAEGTAPDTRADAHKGRAGDGPRQPGTQAREPAPARRDSPPPKAGHPRRPARPRSGLPVSPWRFFGAGPGAALGLEGVEARPGRVLSCACRASHPFVLRR